jgi:phosphoglycerate dehydrogenase-like enzyme
MSEIVPVTEPEFSKGRDIFEAATGLKCEGVAPEEAAVAARIRATKSRIAILGVYPYDGPVYEALAENAGSEGALIARFGVGHDNIKKPLARRSNITLTNTPGVLTQSVAEHAIWLMGALARHIPRHDATVRSGGFEAEAGMEFAGKTIAIIGFGAIGRRVAAMAHFGFGMRALAADSRTPEEVATAEERDFEQFKAEFGIEEYTADVDAVLQQADVVSMHIPGTQETHDFMDARRIGLLKPTALLVNTSRGAIIDENALHDALAKGRLAGATLDVFKQEPYQPQDPDKDLRKLANVILTAHCSSNTRESNARISTGCVENILNWRAGRMDLLNLISTE